LGCYNPFNLQARSLTCKSTKQFGNHHILPGGSREPPLNSAIAALRKLDLVVVTDLFPESACLMMYKLKGSIPRTCDCKTKKFGIGKTIPHERHQIPPHSPESFPVNEQLWRQVDALTVVDRQLYEVALDRFWDDLRAVEAATGKQLLCRQRVASLCNSTAYIDGLW